MDKDIESIHKLRDEWKAASDARDINKIISLITDDAVILAPNSPPLVGKQAVETMYRTMLNLYKIEQNFIYEEVMVQGDWAYAWGHDEVTMTPLAGGQTLRAKGYGMMIMRREADGWKYARGINNMTRQ
jgi:uncharacterized protein (TIGR02246 family)